MSLSVENLCFSYGSRAVLRGVSFTAEEGELLAVLGANGAGKSTLFRCILGTLSVSGGTVTLDGKDLRTLSPREAAREIAYIPQSHRSTVGYTVLDTALMGVTRQLGAFSQPKKEHVERAMSALSLVGAETLAEREFSQLSGGEQQLVLIARAITQQAKILLMDEPTAALDYGNQLRVLQRVKVLTRQGYTVIWSTHDPQHALRFADKVLALHGGAAIFGTVREALTPTLLRTLYRVDAAFVETAGGTVIVPHTGGENEC